MENSSHHRVQPYFIKVSICMENKQISGEPVRRFEGDIQVSSASANFIIQSSQKAPQTYPVSWSTKAPWKLGGKTWKKQVVISLPVREEVGPSHT